MPQALERGENLDSSEPDDSDSDAEMEESGSQGEGEEGEASDDDGGAWPRLCFLRLCTFRRIK